MTRYEAIEKALRKLIADYESEIHDNYDGTSFLSHRMAEVDDAKDALALPEDGKPFAWFHRETGALRFADLQQMANAQKLPQVETPLYLAPQSDGKTVDAEPTAYTVKRSWPEWLGIDSLPKSGPVLIAHENDSGDRWITEWEASRYHAERLKETQHNFPPHLVWAKAINWMPSPPLPGEVTLVFCNTCGHPSNANDASTTSVVNAELYGLAVELADEQAREEITQHFECDSGHYYECPKALRYLSLREASGEPMPYKVIREGDKVRFE